MSSALLMKVVDGSPRATVDKVNQSRQGLSVRFPY
jgi:hypothetical protein